VLRSKSFLTALGFSAMAVLLLVALGLPANGTPATADKTFSQPQATAPPPGNSDCTQPQEASAPVLEPLEGGSCKATPASEVFTDLKPSFGRTCRCSCGYPCTTDADCGGGIGSCQKGISCC
jgi:hypothetical protein